MGFIIIMKLRLMGAEDETKIAVKLSPIEWEKG